jgi:hypothetical protein
VREQRAQAFQQANAQFKKVKLHRLAVSTRGAVTLIRMRAVVCTYIVCIRGSEKCVSACIAQSGQTRWQDRPSQPGQAHGAREVGQEGL